jgi:hypothetical protein
LVMNDHVIEGAYSFSSVQVCGPGLRTAFALEHANYFTVLRVEHFQDGKRLPAALVAGLNRVGSKLENTSFLKSRSTAITTPSSDTKYHSAHSFSNWRSDIGWRWKRPRTSSRATTSKRWNTVTGLGGQRTGAPKIWTDGRCPGQARQRGQSKIGQCGGR